MSSTGSGVGARVTFEVPPPDPQAVIRPGVIQALASAAGRTVVVSAPPGYRKSTHVARWASADERPAAWVTMDSGLNEPDRLLTVLMAALQSSTEVDARDLLSNRASIRRYGPSRFTSVVAPMLGRVAGSATRPFVMVLDEVHTIEDQTANDLIAAVAYHLPADSTLVLVGNGRHHVPLATLKLRGGIVEISVEDLAFDQVAVRETFESLGGTIDDDEVRSLLDVTEGWPIAVHLAAATAPHRPDFGSLKREQLLSEYVHETWLRLLEAEDVEFLSQVACLDWLSGDLCDYVLDRSDSDTVLARLCHNHQVVLLRDASDDSYRLYRPVRDVLVATFRRRDRRHRRTIHERASQWFERAGHVEEALDHAVASEHADWAERMLIERAPSRMTQGGFLSVIGWIDRLPRQRVLSSAPLCAIAALAASNSGQGDTVLTWVELGRQALAESTGALDDPLVGLIVDVVGAVFDPHCSTESLENSARACSDLPPGTWHVLSCLTHGALAFAMGQIDIAERVLTEGLTEGKVLGEHTLTANCGAHLAMIHARAGNRKLAASEARSARELMRNHSLDDLPNLVVVTAMSALVEAMDGNVPLAREELALTRSNLVHLSPFIGTLNVQARLAVVHASLVLGDRVAAQVLAHEVELYLADQPDVSMPHDQLAELMEALRSVQTSLPYGPSALSTAEMRVLNYLPTNLSLADIATRLFVSRNTAKSHAAAVYRKLGVTSRGEAVDVARSVGLLP